MSDLVSHASPEQSTFLVTEAFCSTPKSRNGMSLPVICFKQAAYSKHHS
jgi:hypothetical protein